MTVRVGIIGAGPAGLITALALEKATSPTDAEFTLIDRNSSVVDSPGVEYTLQVRACRALDRLGLKDAALRVGHPTGRIVLRVMRTDKIQRRIRLDPQYNSEVDRSEFLDNLSKLLRRTEFLNEHVVTEIAAQTHGRVLLRFVPAGADIPEPREFDIVIACDGIDSVARRKYFPAQESFDRGFSAIYFSVVGDPADPHTPAAFPPLLTETPRKSSWETSPRTDCFLWVETAWPSPWPSTTRLGIACGETMGSPRIPRGEQSPRPSSKQSPKRWRRTHPSMSG
jgi:2-polyprenyl-6-methoxyphenol hydroxylase-like FAD-dependent oxidoreductase